MSVTIYGRALYLVDSHSRYGMRHLCDFEPQLNDDGTVDTTSNYPRCSCESWNLRLEQPCRHIRECQEFLADAAKQQIIEETKTRKPVKIYHLKK